MDNQEVQIDYRIPFEEEARWKKHIEEYGFVVIANYLSEEVAKQYTNRFWEIMEILSNGKIKKNDLQSQMNNENYPPLPHGGMVQYVGHSQPQWELRKRCKPIFQKLWECQNVKSSFDGFCFMNGIRKYEKKPHNASLHCDQQPQKKGLWSYQGIMTLTDAGEDQGGFVCVPKSHKHYQKYFEQKGITTYNRSYQVPQADKIKQPLCYDIKLNTKGGDFILFDSRTFHTGTVPLQDTLRLCTYICMLPQNRIPQVVKEAKRKAFEEKRTSNHHTGDGFRTFAELPRKIKDEEQFRQRIKKVNVFEHDEAIEDLL